MDKIVVLIKNSAGNDVAGEMATVVKTFDKNISLGKVFEQMKKLGNWDIIIPYYQEGSFETRGENV